jgi:hypothetical protein
VEAAWSYGGSGTGSPRRSLAGVRPVVSVSFLPLPLSRAVSTAAELPSLMAVRPYHTMSVDGATGSAVKLHRRSTRCLRPVVEPWPSAATGVGRPTRCPRRTPHGQSLRVAWSPSTGTTMQVRCDLPWARSTAAHSGSAAHPLARVPATLGAGVRSVISASRRASSYTPLTSVSHSLAPGRVSISVGKVLGVS